MRITLKQKITEVLKEKSISLSDFADYINVPEDELDGDLEPDTLSLRTLEQICKALRISMYSCFTGSNYTSFCFIPICYSNKFKNEKIRLNEMVTELLKKRNMTLPEFADYINVEKEEFNMGFNPRNLSVRTLEQISKEFRIPLYRLLSAINNN